METDYIIVGLGLAGLSVAEALKKRGRSFVVFENRSQNSSLVAGGMYNPVILRRFTPVWNAEEQLRFALLFYDRIEKRFHKKYNYKIDILRVFKSVEEQNNWLVASAKPVLEKYMIPKVFKNTNPDVNAPYGYGKLTGTGRIDTNALVEDYRSELKSNRQIRLEKFEYAKVRFSAGKIEYKDIIAKKIIFCEGYGVKKNPFFHEIPVHGSKGEVLTIHAPSLKTDAQIKAAVFVLPVGNDRYKVGATFNREDKTLKPTAEGRTELLQKLRTFIKSDFKIIDHRSGIRPTTVDRRPIIGVHPKYEHVAVLNGLGTRGVMNGPLMAEKLIASLEEGQVLEKEISLSRFQKNIKI